MKPKHTWKFFRAGGFDQVHLESGADLLALNELDQKLWVALACPTTGLEFDSKTLALIDTDKDGRIRAPELIAAVNWAAACLKNPDDLLKPSAQLELSAINEDSPEGKQLLASARHILASLGKPAATSITLEDTSDTAKIFVQTRFNGDGIIPADSAEDLVTQNVITDILACLGSELDRSGKPGVSQAKVDQFFAEAQAYSDWWALAEKDPAILPLDGSTALAAATLKSLRPKVNDYFTRCRLAAFDPRALAALNRDEKDYLALAAKELTLGSIEIVGLPLAQVEAGKPLPLAQGINPAWSDVMAQFVEQIVRPILNGKSALTEADWQTVSARFAAYEAWQGAKAGALVEKLGLPRVREIPGTPSRPCLRATRPSNRKATPSPRSSASSGTTATCSNYSTTSSRSAIFIAAKRERSFKSAHSIWTNGAASFASGSRTPPNTRSWPAWRALTSPTAIACARALVKKGKFSQLSPTAIRTT